MGLDSYTLHGESGFAANTRNRTGRISGNGNRFSFLFFLYQRGQNPDPLNLHLLKTVLPGNDVRGDTVGAVVEEDNPEDMSVIVAG